ncbi:prolyl oligopeptidase family serine peptidase [Kurthia sibirica]|uniref:Esterase n=1 Tax=Kurthia sibirica TaxID=202750 RepID=A0A2U3AMU0_9BACL|nr:prolyl oligopeptidase family serine peptidase [Kurthia sibirica]PWI25837.1 esterase [Kurthia sibirica]GEK33656.1 putative esterase YitV [Kurthia sibirica]
MKINHETWGNIPLLHLYNEETANENTPIVIFLHGFESAKEHNLHYAYNYVTSGMRVIMPDAILHGERAEDLDAIQLSMRFWEIVLTNIEELNYIKQQLVDKGLYTHGKIGVSGTSMGAITTLGCLTVYPWIDAAAVMMGTPNYVELAKNQLQQVADLGLKLPMNEAELEKMYETLDFFDISKKPELLANRPVFFWHGKKDHTVPYEPAHRFYKNSMEQYAANPQRWQHMTSKSAGHQVNRTGMLANVQWFADYLL